jgi:hypothetical protein
MIRVGLGFALVRYRFGRSSGWCPRQDPNLPSRLRSPVNHEIHSAFRCPTWVFRSPVVSLMTSRAP